MITFGWKFVDLLYTLFNHCKQIKQYGGISHPVSHMDKDKNYMVIPLMIKMSVPGICVNSGQVKDPT